MLERILGRVGGRLGRRARVESVLEDCSTSVEKGYRAAREAAGRAFYGWARSRLRGRGVDYVDFRDYYPGDDVRDIDWRLSARLLSLDGSPRLVVKVYEEEKEVRVLLVVDTWPGILFWDKPLSMSFAASFISEQARLFEDHLVYAYPSREGWEHLPAPPRTLGLPKPVREAICSPPPTRPSLSSLRRLVLSLRPSVAVLVTDYGRVLEEYSLYAKTLSALGSGQLFVYISSVEELGLASTPRARVWLEGLGGVAVYAGLEDFYRAIGTHRRLVKGVTSVRGGVVEIVGRESLGYSIPRLVRGYLAARARTTRRT